MSLEEKTRNILNDFDNTPSDTIIQTLEEITTHFKSDLTRDYLRGKIKSILTASDETEKKNICKNLVPYLDWYLQGV